MENGNNSGADNWMHAREPQKATGKKGQGRREAVIRRRLASSRPPRYVIATGVMQRGNGRGKEIRKVEKSAKFSSSRRGKPASRESPSPPLGEMHRCGATYR